MRQRLPLLKAKQISKDNKIPASARKRIVKCILLYFKTKFWALIIHIC